MFSFTAPTIIRSKKRRRSVALRVEADGSLTVRAPMRVSLAWINAFVAAKAKWISRRQKAQATKRQQALPVLADGCLVPYLGQEAQVVVNGKDEDNPLTSYIRISLPEGLPADLLHDEIKTELTLWYKKQARKVFQERVNLWAGRMGLQAGRVIITAPKRRWGSCSAKNEIRLNWRLIMAPLDVLDYVIVHELAHITHKNHGPRFWALVAAFAPEMKEKRQALRMFDKSPHTLLFS